MSKKTLVEKLAKANRDVKKLGEFFAARKGWLLALDAGESARNLIHAASTIDERLKALIEKSGSQPTRPDHLEVILLPVGTLDHGRLQRFATFLRDLDTWFAAQNWEEESPKDIAEFQEMETNLACIIDLVETLSVIPEPPATAESATDGATAAAAPGETIATIPEGAPLQLVLDDTDEAPLVQEFQNIKELTADCQKAVDDFLAAWGIELSYYNRKKLLERLLRWISSAPEGHVLVMKMKTAEVPFEPYPSYISRDVLAGKPPRQDPW
jgi:hypothetical protein